MRPAGTRANMHTFRLNIGVLAEAPATTRDYSRRARDRGALAVPGALSIDALGTLVELLPPVPALGAALEGAGFPQPEDALGKAFAAEVGHYRANMARGRDELGLSELRQDCARVFATHLPAPSPVVGDLAEILVSSLRFRAHPDAVPALDALRMAGVPVVVLSNWDCSLAGLLERMGIGERVDEVLASAVIGSEKPAREAFRHAARRLGQAPSRIMHVGDDPRRDAEGASAAGFRAVLLDREGAAPAGPWPTISTLAELPGLFGLAR